MEHKVFQWGAPHGLLILKYVKENDGCTVAEVKQCLGIPLSLSPLSLLIRHADRIPMEIAATYFKKLAVNKLITTDQSPESIKRWALRIANSSHLYITSEGEEVLRSHGRRIIQLLNFIQGKKSSLIKDVDIYWKQTCSGAIVLDDDFGHLRLSPIVACGFVELDGPLRKGDTVVKLTEKGSMALKDQPENVLRLIYG